MNRLMVSVGESVKKVAATMTASVVALLSADQVATPPVGTPAAGSLGGNSAPAHTPVAGRQKSEQLGEQTGCSLPVAGLLGSVHHG